LSRERKTEIEGSFSNVAAHDPEGYGRTLWERLTDTEQKIRESPGEQTVRIQMRSERQLYLRLMQNDVELEATMLDGTFQNGYFSVKRRYRWKVIFFPIYGFGDVKLHLGVTLQRHLLVDYDEGGVLLVAVFPIMGAGNHIESIFHRQIPFRQHPIIWPRSPSEIWHFPVESLDK
jgi:hypothetical protein